MQNPKRILFTGGGSGGHLVPNLALVTELKRLDPAVQLFYLGSRRPLDRILVEKAGIPFKPILTGKWRRYFDWKNFVDPWLLLAGFFQALYYLIRFWPQVVFTKGGYVGLPVALAAWFLRRPIILHESDAVMGVANRLTARLAKKVFLGFPGSLALSHKVEVVGNPVRPFIKTGTKEKGYALTGFTSEHPILLVWGGSQGAQEINEMVMAEFQELKKHFQIVHITGIGKKTGIRDPFYREFEYLEETLPSIYAITDLVFGRAGANSLAELAYLKQPNVLLPLASSAHHHQEINAAYFETQGASILLKDKKVLVPTLVALWENKEARQKMQAALERISCPEAALKMAHDLLAL